MLVAKKIPKSLSAESYRSLRSSIRFANIDKDIKTIVVTSSIAGEGKSTISGNLAYILSQDESRVLIIDCDLRKPDIHQKFYIDNGKGLSDVLVGECALKDVIKKIEDSLFLITAGTIPPNPSELLGSHAMEDLLNEVSDTFDYIVIDTSPILPVTDALILAAKSDATIIVARAKKTNGKIIKQSYDKLIEAKANIIGSVLNDCNKSIDKKHYGYYNESKNKKR